MDQRSSHTRKLFSLLCVALPLTVLVLTGHPPLARALDESQFSRAEGLQDLPWELEADTLKVNKALKVAEAEGHVLISQEDNFLQADYARYYWETKWVYLRGNVRARFGQDTLQAEEAELDLENDVGWIKNGRVFLQEPHLYFKGEKLTRTGPSRYEFEQAEVTACDGDTPAWSLKTSEGRITIDGYARLKHPRFRVKDNPVLYSPYLVLPVKRQRQSGFLMPEYSQSSRDGTGINLPYFWAINEENDATLFTNVLSDRGVMLGAEVRTTPNLQTMGVFRLDWLEDRVTAETEEDEFDQFDDDGLIRPNETRYWLRGKLNGFLFNPEWKTKLDVDFVSDQNYLRNFDSGYSGFENSRELFLDEFGRDIDDKDDLTRTSVWTVSRNWSHIGFESRVEVTQNLEYMNDNLDSEDNPTLQRLPELNLDVYKHQLLDTVFEWEAQNELTSFWRREGTTGFRADLHPRLSLPWRTAYGTVIPKVGFRETLYYTDSFEEESEKNDRTRSRGLFDFETVAFTEVFRIYDLSSSKALSLNQDNLGQSAWTKIKHSLKPEVSYSFIPDQDQEDLPSYDSTDRIEPENELTYSITSTLTRRKDTVVSVATQNASRFEQKSDYRDVLRLKAEQSYDFEEANRKDDRDAYPRRPFSDVRVEIDFSPASWLSLSQTTWISPYEGTVTEHEHMLRLSYLDRFSSYFGLDYIKELNDDYERRNQEELKILKLGGHAKLGRKWDVYAHYEYDQAESELINQTVGVGTTHQCWGLNVSYEKTEDEDRVTLMVNLHQLGAIEQSFTPPGEQ